MKSRSILLCSLLILAFTVIAATSENESGIIGSWEFSVNEAPWEYSRGMLIIELNEEEALTGKIEFSTGRVIQVPSVTLENDRIVFDVNVDGYDVKTDFTLSENTLSGTVYTIEGNMHFSAKRAGTE